MQEESEAKTQTQGESATATAAPSFSPHDLQSMYEDLGVKISEHLGAVEVSDDERNIRADELRKMLDRMKSMVTDDPPVAAPGLAPPAPSTSPAPASSTTPAPAPAPAPSVLARYVCRAWIEWYKALPDKVRDEIVAYCRDEIGLIKKVSEMYEAEDRSDINVLLIIYVVLGVFTLQDYFTQVNSVDRQYQRRVERALLPTALFPFVSFSSLALLLLSARAVPSALAFYLPSPLSPLFLRPHRRGRQATFFASGLSSLAWSYTRRSRSRCGRASSTTRSTPSRTPSTVRAESIVNSE
jgi:hypothetical protein